MQTIRYEQLTATNYAAYFEKCGALPLGQIMLPLGYNISLWGVLAYANEELIGGWVGTKRISGKVDVLYQEIVMDAIPQWFAEVDEDSNTQLIHRTIQQAKNDKIALLTLSHWSRGMMPMMPSAHYDTAATFLIYLHHTEDELWSGVDSKQRNIIRKGDKSGVVVEHYAGKEILAYLRDFQQLRQTTQSRAIRHNKNASMLLKSDAFFSKIFTEQRSRLFLAKYEGEVVSVALMLEGGKTAYYYSGGSDIEVNKKTGASAHLLWKAICYYREREYAYFDMGGVPVNPDKTHPAYGVYSFKKSLGGEYKEYTSGDIVISAWRYKLIQLIKQNRTLLRLLSKKL